MKVFICTSGTSIATNRRIDIRDIENKPLSRKKDFELAIQTVLEEVDGFFADLDIRSNPDDTSAEIKSLACMELKAGDRVYFLVSDTIDGEVCAELNKKYLEQEWGCDVVLEPIKGLQALDSNRFRHEGLKGFLETLIRLIETHRNDDVCLNITGGYRSVVPYVTLLGMIYERPIKYIYEDSAEVITLERIPITYDELLVLQVEKILALIAEKGKVEGAHWERSIPPENRARYASLIQKSDPGYVTLSGIGLVFFEKYKNDFPLNLDKDLTPAEVKPVVVDETDVGKEILTLFAQRLCLSPFIKAISGVLPNDPDQVNPIKRCHDDGKLEIVLVQTEPGYSLLVQTTGRNLTETKQIADLLRKKYGLYPDETKRKIKVFISYAREDRDIAERLYNDLKRIVGVVPWLDTEDLIAGQNFKNEIRREIKNSTYYIPLFSSCSINKVGFFQRELKIAIDLLNEFPPSVSFIIPVRIDDCKPLPDEFIHWVDLFPSYEAGLKKILRVFLPELSG